MTTALIYARVSSQEQGQGWSIATQLEACREYAIREGYTVAAEHSDMETGASVDRAGFQAIMAAIRRGDADALIVYHSDRLHRDLVHALTTRRELKQLGIELHTVRRGRAGTTPEAEFTDSIDDLISEYERMKIRERTNRGRRGKALGGQMIGNGPAPYGYVYVGEGRQRHLEIDERHAPTVRQIFQWYAYGDASGPVSVHEIARRLTGVPTPSERQDDNRWRRKRAPGIWAAAHLYPILRNTTYSGQFHAFRIRRDGTKHRIRPESEHIIVPTPAIIDAATWAATQKRLDTGRQQSTRQAKHPYLVGRRVRCACGMGAHGRASGERGETRRLWYVCNGRIRGTVTACAVDLSWTRAETVDAAVWGYVAGAISSDEAIAEAFAAGRSDPGDAARAERADLERRREKLERQRALLLDVLLSEEISRAEWRRRSQPIDEQIAALTQQIATLPPPPDALPDDTEGAVRELAARLRPTLGALTFAARRQIIEALDVWVTLQPDKMIEVRSVFGVASVSIV